MTVFLQVTYNQSIFVKLTIIQLKVTADNIFILLSTKPVHSKNRTDVTVYPKLLYDLILDVYSSIL